jgi:Flp pilus assembly protein TadD
LAQKSGDTAQAIKLMQKSLDALPLADTHRSLCHLYVMRRDWKNAAKHSGLAAETDPNDAVALLLHAAQLHRANEPQQAERVFNKALQIAGVDGQGKAKEPVHCCVWYNAAGYRAVTGDADRALQMLQAFFDTPNHRHLTREQISDDPDFAELKKDPRFGELLKKYLSEK